MSTGAAPLRRVNGRKPRLFPMHLTPFEQYMLTDDTPTYPMTFVAQLDFSGALNEEAITDALEDALARHPLISAVVQSAKRNTECWVRDESVSVEIRWQSFDEDLDLDEGEFIDIRNQPGTRIWIQHDSDRARITIQSHHATCDGLGSYHFIGDWLHFYAQRVGEKDLPELPEYPILPMRRRFNQSCDLSQFLGDEGEHAVDWSEFDRLKQQQAQSLRRPGYELPSTVEFPGVVVRTIDKNEYRHIRLRAQKHGLMPNDWCLVHYFYTLLEWNWQGHNGSGDLPISVLVPMNLREASNPLLSACNVVTHSMISRHRSCFVNQREFSDSVRQEVALLKQQRHESPFMYMLSGAYKYPELMDEILDPTRCHATGVLSNSGDPTKLFHTRFPTEGRKMRCGNLTLESWTGVPPLRHNTRVAVSLLTYRRQLTVCMRCEPRHFSTEHTSELLDRYVARITGKFDGES